MVDFALFHSLSDLSSPASSAFPPTATLPFHSTSIKSIHKVHIHVQQFLVNSTKNVKRYLEVPVLMFPLLLQVFHAAAAPKA